MKTDQGVLYTRTGNLSLNRDGTLITQEGWPVLGKGGPISVNSKNATLRIETNGQLFDGDQNIDSLDLVKFPPKTSLTRTKNGYFKPTDPQATPSGLQIAWFSREPSKKPTSMLFRK